MSKDTIYRQDVMNAFDCSIGGVPVESVKYVSEYADKMMSRINALSSAKPERKKGKWYKPTGMMPPEYAGVYRCSECGEIAMRDWKHHRQELSNFCPNCGADMREGQDEHNH